MMESDPTPTLVFEARIRVKSAKGFGARKGIQKGFASSLHFEGKYYPSQIVECEGEIMPGESGDVTVFMLNPKTDGAELVVGSSFLLTGGPRVVIAEGQVRTSPRYLDATS